jgi:hypothetical protein
MANELKVLAPFNLPYIERRFNPGDTVSVSEIQEYADEAEKQNPDGETMTAEETVEHFIAEGVLSEDLDAELHPQHRPLNANEQNAVSVIAQSKALVQQMEQQGVEIPEELKAMAEADPEKLSVSIQQLNADVRSVSAGDSGNGGDSSGK